MSYASRLSTFLNFNHSWFRPLATALTMAIAAGTTIAAPVNYVQNGSFENGLDGWTLTGFQGEQPAVAIYYYQSGPYPEFPIGESVPAANSVTQSPDAAADRAVYFVADTALNAGLTQNVFLTAGRYRVGFDAYAPSNGYHNAGDAEFSATIAGLELTEYFVSTRPATTWVNYSGLATVTQDGFYDVTFLFNTSTTTGAKDLVIDRVYAIATNEGGGTDIPPNNVPEPSSVALIGAALLALRVKQRQSKNNAL